MSSEKLKLWQSLLSDERLCGEPRRQTDMIRSEFERDYGRIIYSSAFRRLQDKTQVFPFSVTDYTRTRLTHTLEVASVGRTLGILAGKHLHLRLSLHGRQITDKHLPSPQEFGTLVASACLAHDLGNPPFGHSGEDAIRKWAENHTSSLESNHEVNDLQSFEGNAQGFRILTRHFRRMGGVSPTFALIGAMMKYPCPSTLPHGSDKNDKDVSKKKFGYFNAERPWAIKAFNHLRMIRRSDGVYARHPLAFLLEAADDICYGLVDLEDAHKLNLLGFKTIAPPMRALMDAESRRDYDYARRNGAPEDVLIRKLRAAAVNTLVKECVRVFMRNLAVIESGTMKDELIARIDKNYRGSFKTIRALIERHVYTDQRVLQIELAGFKTLGGLLDIFWGAVVLNGTGKENEKLRQIFPRGMLFKDNKFSKESNEKVIDKLTRYERILALTDFVSGMTDRYAIEMYQRLSGIKLPL
ncbi:MAG: dNTP triphosphohydrolase [Verrucomicrobia bacterium]|nr:dNTP triphosphohydrolase [Verrucomicrobiota bacterium]